MKHRYPNTIGFVLTMYKRILLLIVGFALSHSSQAAVTITKASGGTSVSADKAANGGSPQFTTLGNLIITENLATDFAIGTNVTLTMSAATGWTFNTGAIVTANATGGDIISANVTSITNSLITMQLTISTNVNVDVLTVSGIQIRTSDGGNVPGTANLTRGGTAAISGCASGVSLASLSQVAGVVNKLVVTFPGQTFSDAATFATSGNTGTPTSQTAGTNFVITKIRACDQFFNVVTTYSGVKTLSYSGPSSGLTGPTYITSVSFASGLSSTSLTTNLKRSETTAITVSDGTTTGPVSSTIIVNPGAVANFLVQGLGGGNIGSQTTGIPFDIRLTARDANSNYCTTGPNTFNGTATITSTGTLTSGSGTTASFSGGVLTAHTVEISNGGNFTITATKTAGAQNGISNSFAVNYPASLLSGISPSCVTPGDPDFVLTVDGNNFNGLSVVRFNGSDRNTTFLSSTQLLADIDATDIATSGVYEITVFTPSSGTTAPLVIGENSSSTDIVSICQGYNHTMPDGSIENTDGTYYTTIPGSTGCDSVITTILTVDPAPERMEDVYICPGDSYTLPDGTIESNPGTYYSIVPNSPGCDSVITTNIYLLDPPILVATPNQITCFGINGSVTLDPLNGTAPFTFGGDPSSNLSPGTYFYSVTDANGCMDNTSATIDPEPDQLTIDATPTQITCFGGTGEVSLVANGGTGSLTFDSTPTTGLTQGVYVYTVTDDNGCTASDAVTINAAPASLTATMAVIKTLCGTSNGSATVTVSGGFAPYTYSWNTTPVRTTRSITGLPVGAYVVTATDQHGCTVNKTATITNANSTSFTITGVKGVCPGGTTTLSAKAGYASYAWNTGETTQNITVATVDTFTVVATDTNGCQTIASTTTHTGVIPVCTITGGELCPNSSLTLRAPYGMSYYMWNTGGRNSTLIVRNAGTYSVTIKNADGCSASSSYVVNAPMRITVTKVDGRCVNEFKGSAAVSATQGVPPYTYLWGNGQTTTSITGLNAGNYAIRVTDAGGCYSLFTTTINSYKTTYDYSILGTNFNATPVSSGSYIWFSAVANVTYTGNYPVTIRFTNQNISSSRFTLTPSNSKLIITNAVSTATTVYTNGEWVTTAPPNLSGNYFVGGYAYPVAIPLAASLNPVKWKGIWSSSSSCATNIQWKWSAAVYSSFTPSYSLIDVNPCDDNSASPYGNGNLAGTPENFTGGCIAGALGLGGSNYVGSYSPLINRLPCSTPDSCNSNRIGVFNEVEESDFIINAYPNPFNSKTYIEFQRKEKSGHLVIEVYTFYGQKMKTIFEADVEAGALYRTELDATDWARGIYVYRLIGDDEETSGKLILE